MQRGAAEGPGPVSSISGTCGLLGHTGPVRAMRLVEQVVCPPVLQGLFLWALNIPMTSALGTVSFISSMSVGLKQQSEQAVCPSSSQGCPAVLLATLLPWLARQGDVLLCSLPASRQTALLKKGLRIFI